MSTWFRIQEFVVEIGLRLAKVVVASLIGLVVYVVLTGPFGDAGRRRSSRSSPGSPGCWSS